MTRQGFVRLLDSRPHLRIVLRQPPHVREKLPPLRLRDVAPRRIDKAEHQCLVQWLRAARCERLLLRARRPGTGSFDASSPDMGVKPVLGDAMNEHDLRAKWFEARETPGDWRVLTRIG